MTNVDIDELAGRLGEPDLVVLDVRNVGEYDGTAGAACDPRQGHIPGARNLNVLEFANAPSPEKVRALVGEPEGTEIIAYCHSGSRSDVAAHILRASGYNARNYRGSWHEWSRRDDLPIE